MKRQSSIQDFFTKGQNVDRPGVENLEARVAVEGRSEIACADVFQTSSSGQDVEGIFQVIKNVNDIGNYCQRSYICSLTNDEKVSLLENVWKPQSGYKFPTTSISNHTRSFQAKWLEEFQWLTYSEEKCGAFCKYCVFFSQSEHVGKGNHQSLGIFVTQPFINFKKAREMFKNHQDPKYHRQSILIAENTKSLIKKKRESVIDQVNSRRKLDIENNRKKLVAIIQNIKLCGRQMIALRGHNDSGRVSLEEPDENDGNFRSLLRYRANSGDNLLKDQLISAGGKTMYTSPVIQNDIINTFGSLIQSKIVAKVRNSIFYSVLADETTDISQIEQFSLCIRYVDEETFKIREDFLTFVPVHDVTGAGLAKTVLETLSNLGLDLNKLRGQGYDGAATMSGKFRGVQAAIREKLPLALYTHCSSHTLNLCLSDASGISSIRNCMGVIKEICAFFHASAKNTEILKSTISDCFPDEKRKKLISLCETRWVERHDSVILFKEILEAIILSLHKIEESSVSSTKAFALSRAICTFPFIVNLFILSQMLSTTHSLSETLQKKNIDLSQAISNITTVLDLLSKQRSNAEQTFKPLYEQVKTIASKLFVTEELPRFCRLQTTRNNVPYTTEEEYYRRAVYVPYLDDFCEALRERFQSHKDTIISLQNILPQFCIRTDITSLEAALKLYEPDLSFNDIVRSEFKLWQEKWKQERPEVLPKTAISSLENCDKDLFPNIYILLKILAVLPVSVATVERTFSSLRRLKTYLRNSTSENRLNGLALLSIHRDITVSDEEVLDKFASVPRKLGFVL
ncbi:52 kDa repressor of the inhibitor of the protein kinase-like [Coccinella septempunctata]|uniref:52 kDa repressor of the inhibitor of the protein kinase-like n=1 Tax=Coccinella septempunctata TaxID=41139 RepID=UPI001D0879F6|nr:52 kDa repressor of the inhibitor of the protein kinase-like [Coccinella septempunctata]